MTPRIMLIGIGSSRIVGMIFMIQAQRPRRKGDVGRPGGLTGRLRAGEQPNSTKAGRSG